MANVRTITDLLNTEEPVQYIVLREAGEEVGTQTTVSGTGSGLNDTLRDIARERLNTSDFRLPVLGLTDNDVPVADDIRNLNSSLGGERPFEIFWR